MLGFAKSLLYWSDHPKLPNGHIAIKTKEHYLSVWVSHGNYKIVEEENKDYMKGFINEKDVKTKTTIIKHFYRTKRYLIDLINENINKVKVALRELPPGEAMSSFLRTQLSLAFTWSIDLDFENLEHEVNNTYNCAMIVNKILFAASLKFTQEIETFYRPTEYLFNNIPTPYRVSNLKGNELYYLRSNATRLRFIY